MYLGYYPSKISLKNQLTFPSKFKKDIGRKLLITTWFEKCLIVLPFDKGEKILGDILISSSSLLPEARDIERFLFGNAHEVNLDEKNRFVLPHQLRNYADIQKRCIFIGIKERVELWDEVRYQNYEKIREIQIRETAINHYNRIVKR